MSLSKEKIKHFKQALEDEKAKIEAELSGVGRKNPGVPGDWEATPEVLAVEVPDSGEMASNIEQMENRSAIEDSLEERLVFINGALERIANGTYGMCVFNGKSHPIEGKRLEANPAATECIEHSRG